MRTRMTLTVAAFAAGSLVVGLVAAAGGQPKADAPGQSLGIASVANLRDVGGHTTRDGHVVRTKRLYRSNQFSKVSADDTRKLADLGLKRVYDLRNASERKAQPDDLPPGVTSHWLDVFADSDQAAPARLRRLLQKPKEANEAGVVGVDALYATAFRELVALPGARKAYGRLFTDLGREETLPAVVHCTSGKDRTGWAVAALLALLGVPEGAIVDDFLRSNEYVLPTYQKAIDGFVKAGGDAAVAKAILGARAESLKASFDEVKTRYGTIEEYFAKGLSVDAAGQQALRDRFLARAGDK